MKRLFTARSPALAATAFAAPLASGAGLMTAGG
jgi:hypothetical protein